MLEDSERLTSTRIASSTNKSLVVLLQRVAKDCLQGRPRLPIYPDVSDVLHACTAWVRARAHELMLARVDARMCWH